jgi:hypothetical protein
MLIFNPAVRKSPTCSPFGSLKLTNGRRVSESIAVSNLN